MSDRSYQKAKSNNYQAQASKQTESKRSQRTPKNSARSSYSITPAEKKELVRLRTIDQYGGQLSVENQARLTYLQTKKANTLIQRFDRAAEQAQQFSVNPKNSQDYATIQPKPLVTPNPEVEKVEEVNYTEDKNPSLNRVTTVPTPPAEQLESQVNRNNNRSTEKIESPQIESPTNEDRENKTSEITASKETSSLITTDNNSTEDPTAKSQDIAITNSDRTTAPIEAAAIDADSPGQILEQLKNTPPVQAVTTYAQAQAASIAALEKQRKQVIETIPEIPAPTGLPAREATQEDRTAQTKTPSTPELKESADAEIQNQTEDRPSPKQDIPVPEIPPPPPPTPTLLAGSETSEAESQDPALSSSAQNALQNVQINTDRISTSAGEPPNVDLTGQADPTQIETATKTKNQEVNIAKIQAAKEIDRDFGENDIFPEADNETLKADPKPGTISPPEASTGESASIPGEAVGSVNQALSPFLTEKIGIEQNKYQAGKAQFDLDSAKAKTDADLEIANLNRETKQEQLAQQQEAKSLVAQYKLEWKSELDTAEQDYLEKAENASQSQRQKIGDEKTKGEREAAKHLEEAENKAIAEKQKANQEAAREKQKAQKESGGFIGWIKSKAKNLIDGLKQAFNSIYENLRKAIKAIFEAAKKLALAAIDLARKAIVELIRGFGEILKGLVKVIFAAFPEIAKRINDKIAQAVNNAEKAVNAAANSLKTAIAAVLDFLANTLDSLLKLLQDIYNGIFTIIGMVINGELAEILKGISNLIDAAGAAPPQFETAGYEELLGGDLDRPLSPAEITQARALGIDVPGLESADSTAPVPESELPKPPWTPENVEVDGVENNMELAPELVAELIALTNGDGEVMLGESDDPSRSIDSILAEVSEDKQSNEAREKQDYPDDGLNPRQRASIKWELMKQGLSQWWSENWPAVMGVGVLGVAGFLAANVVTGGAVTAVLPAIMGVLGPLFVGVTAINLAGHIRDYLALGWEGDIQGGGKSLAKGLAAGAVELISLVTFKAGDAALRGAKAAARGVRTAGKAGVRAARSAMRAIARGAKYLIEKGKVIFRGIAGTGIGKQFKRLQDLGEGLLARMRFKAFRIRIKNREYYLEGFINPWVLIARGTIQIVKKDTPGAKFLTDSDLTKLESASVPKTGNITEFEAVPYKESTTQGRGVVGDQLTGDHIPSRAALVAAEEKKLGRRLTSAEKRKIRDEGVTVVIKDNIHKELSRTYGGRNTSSQVGQDSQDLAVAFHEDAKQIIEGLENRNELDLEVISAYLEAYNKNLRLGKFPRNHTIENLINDYVDKLKE